jgi:hypothetical protein
MMVAKVAPRSSSRELLVPPMLSTREAFGDGQGPSRVRLLGRFQHLLRSLMGWARRKLSTMAKSLPKPSSWEALGNGQGPSQALLAWSSQQCPKSLSSLTYKKLSTMAKVPLRPYSREALSSNGQSHSQEPCKDVALFFVWCSIKVLNTRERMLKCYNFFFFQKK